MAAAAGGGGCRPHPLHLLLLLPLLLLALLVPLIGPHVSGVLQAAGAAWEQAAQAGSSAAAAAGGADAAAAAAAGRKYKYSQMQCAGGSGPDTGIDGTEDFFSCLMHDVCYDFRSGELLYYTDGSPVLVEGTGFAYNFTSPLVLLEPVRQRDGGRGTARGAGGGGSATGALRCAGLAGGRGGG